MTDLLATVIPLFPDAASQYASRVDRLFIILLIICGGMSLLVFGLMIVFGTKYWSKRRTDRSGRIYTSIAIEGSWLVGTLIVFVILFAAGAALYFDVQSPPADAEPIYVVAKQWMWQVQHPEGRREINEIHVPVGRPVKVILRSEDVIHDLFLPEFRVKQDALPSRYTSLWFTAEKPGTYRLLCAEYCGTNHSRMTGRLIAMEEDDYRRWLEGGVSGSLASQGEKLFSHYACDSCHKHGGRGPDLGGLIGRRVSFSDGSSMVADQEYVRQSILRPAEKVVVGYQNIMPSYEGKIDEVEMIKLLAFIESTRGTVETEPGATVPDPELER